MRYKTLGSLVDDLRAECRRSLNPAHNNQVRDTQVKTIQHVQEWLWEDFTWPHLRVTRDIPLQAGQRYYDLPEDLDIDRVEMIEVRYNGRWMRLDTKIEACHYEQFDSDLGVRAWPIERWQIYEGEQVEVWPIPDTDADSDTLEGTLRVTGIKKLTTLVADDDRADLDSRLIILYAAADILTGQGSKDGSLKLSQANKLYARLRSGLTPRGKFKMFSGDNTPKFKLRGPPPVYYRTTTS
jgi:hypothetical protein